MAEAGDRNGRYAMALPRSDLFSEVPEDRSKFIKTALLEHVYDNSRPILRDGSSCFPCHALESVRAHQTFIPIDNVSSFVQSDASDLMRCYSCHMPRLQVDERGYSTKDHRMFGAQYLLDLTAIEPDREQLKRLRRFSRKTRMWLSANLPELGFPHGYGDEIRLPVNPADFFRITRRRMKIERIAGGGRGHFNMRLVESEVESDAGRRRVHLSIEVQAPHIGHDFPSTLFANISRTWFKLSVYDARGIAIYGDGSPEPGESLLGRLEVLEDGTVIRPDQNLDYHNITNRRWIKPDRPFIKDYEFDPGPDALLPFTARFSIQRMRYNPVDREWLGLPDSPRFDPITLQAETFEVR
jgi:hypothetical protein